MALTGETCKYCGKWVSDNDFFTIDICNDCARENKLNGFDKIRAENSFVLKRFGDVFGRASKRISKN